MLAASPGWAAQAVIHLPQGVASETVFIRYVRAGEKFGGWVRSQPGVSSYAINTSIGAVPATGLKAIMYAPGCAIQTVDLRLAGAKDAEYTFLREPLPSILISGRLIEAESLRDRGARIQARYIARWAHAFLGLTDDTVLVIPVGETSLASDAHFEVAVPDLFQDRLAGGSADGELQLWAKDRAGQNLVAQLIPKNATRMGGLKIPRDYPPEVAFTVCRLNRSTIRDEQGFAHRSDVEGCSR
jgi:hypothetical protein